MELSTYFRINALNTGQFERTLISIPPPFFPTDAELPSEVMTNQPIYEIIMLRSYRYSHSTDQNYPGDVLKLVSGL